MPRCNVSPCSTAVLAALLLPGCKQQRAALPEGRLPPPDFTGTCTTRHPNGRKLADWSYENGRLHGKTTWWYPSGAKQSEQWFEDGNAHGKVISWYENGQKKTEGNYHADKRMADGCRYVGVWTWWSEGGDVIAKGEHIDDGMRGEGTFADWDEVSKRWRISTFEKGIRVSTEFLTTTESGHPAPDAPPLRSALLELTSNMQDNSAEAVNKGDLRICAGLIETHGKGPFLRELKRITLSDDELHLFCAVHLFIRHSTREEYEALLGELRTRHPAIRFWPGYDDR